MLLGEEVDDTSGNAHTGKFLKYLKAVTGALPEKAYPISLEDYTKEVQSIRSSTYSGPSLVIPAMVKTEVLYPELRGI